MLRAARSPPPRALPPPSHLHAPTHAPPAQPPQFCTNPNFRGFCSCGGDATAIANSIASARGALACTRAPLLPHSAARAFSALLLRARGTNPDAPPLLSPLAVANGGNGWWSGGDATAIANSIAQAQSSGGGDAAALANSFAQANGGRGGDALAVANAAAFANSG